jgi:hypothetical protein
MEYNDYYVYVYLDPRKPGNYVYSEFEFQFEPFYIGKGRNHRYRIHLLKVKGGSYKNLPKYNKIKKILDSGMDPIIIKYKMDLHEKDSFDLEKNMIKSIGRKDLNNGPLTNLSDGGEGNGGKKFTDEHRANISLSKKGKVSDRMKKHLKSVHERMKGNKRTLGFKFTEESKTKMSESRKKKPVLQMNESGEILREFTSIKSAEDYIGYDISRVLRGEGKTAGGFFWKYKDDSENNKVIEKINNKIKKNRTGKEIIMMDLNMNILSEYRTITEASKDTNISIGNISKNLTGKGKTAGGFFWMYKNNH